MQWHMWQMGEAAAASGDPSLEECEDLDKRCVEWAQLEKCSVNSEFMGRVCCVSCGGVMRQGTLEAQAGSDVDSGQAPSATELGEQESSRNPQKTL